MTATSERRSVWTRLYHGETRIDFMARRRRWFAISGIVILAGLISLGTRQLNLGIDFEGGTSWEVPARGTSVDEVRDALPTELRDAKIQSLGSGLIRVQAAADTKRKADDITQRLAKAASVPVTEISVNDVGPSWGEEISKKAVRALGFFLVAITLYITLRFEWKMALATLAALLHDILVTIGVYSLFGFEVTPPTVIAILTILGYSIYDGIVVFDKVEENTKPLALSGKMTYMDMVNRSLNDVLMRTLNTSLTALLPILSLLIIGSFVLGATTLQEFAVALLVGLGASAYSSIFIASPVLAILKEREPRFVAIRARLTRGGTVASAGPPLVPGMAAATAGGSGAAPPLVPGEGRATDRPAARPATIAPRGRKKQQRRKR
ncbi:MAG TPA: protein translocase subunit SecF [Acidimicrobiales bacterium]|nr:protein translocase subunit SecF [Acidimicrobiales bacterium]